MRKISAVFMAVAAASVLISCGGGGKSSADDPDIRSYTVTWNYNYPGGKSVTEYVQSGSLLIKHEMETDETDREGSYFTEKWYMEASCETEWNFDADKVTSDTVLYAEWKYKPYLVFRSTEQFSLSAGKKWDGSIDWSVDTEEWNTDWDGSSVEAVKSSVNDYYYLYVRGKNSRINSALNIAGEKVECWGSVMTLLDYENPDSVILKDGEKPEETDGNECAFARMFQGCTCLTIAPELPSVKLSEGCYKYMFKGCTGLAAAPDLPAAELSDACYMCMFEGCTALETAPELPAVTLTDSCYGSMFCGCTNLKTAPELPAAEMKKDCYGGMFKDCSSLETAPAELPAEILAEQCYEAMFMNCTKLNKAPFLPADELIYGCYWDMFNGCSSLNISDSSGTEIITVPESDDLVYTVDGMFSGTAGIFSEGYGTPEPGIYYWN